jgi:hypothetical protein
MAKTSGQLEKERIREKSQINISDLTVCYSCKSTGLVESDVYCPNCAFPQRGTQAEMKNFMRMITDKRNLLEGQKKAVNKARNILFVLAGLNFLFGIILGTVSGLDIASLLGGIIGAAIYLALGLWCRKQPFPAILSGFFVYIVFNAIAAIDNPHTLYQGILVKGVIISGFIYGYRGVKESKKLEAELELLKNAKDLNATDLNADNEVPAV